MYHMFNMNDIILIIVIVLLILHLELVFFLSLIYLCFVDFDHFHLHHYIHSHLFFFLILIFFYRFFFYLFYVRSYHWCVFWGFICVILWLCVVCMLYYVLCLWRMYYICFCIRRIISLNILNILRYPVSLLLPTMKLLFLLSVCAGLTGHARVWEGAELPKTEHVWKVKYFACTQVWVIFYGCKTKVWEGYSLASVCTSFYKNCAIFDYLKYIFCKPWKNR